MAIIRNISWEIDLKAVCDDINTSGMDKQTALFYDTKMAKVFGLSPQKYQKMTYKERENCVSSQISCEDFYNRYCEAMGYPSEIPLPEEIDVADDDKIREYVSSICDIPFETYDTYEKSNEELDRD